jgi:type 1 glutamine amidotransferase
MRTVRGSSGMALVAGLALGCGRSAQPRDAAARAADAEAPAADAGAATDTGTPPADGPIQVQVFTRTKGYRHDSIVAGLSLFDALDQRGEIALRATEDPAQLVDELAQIEVVVFLSTSGDVLDDAQQDALEAFVRDGGGFVGVHAAADTEYDWPFYAELLGARFENHPEIQSARIVIEASDHPATAGLPEIWERVDEWYDFDRQPRDSGVQVLLGLDESSYQGGSHGADHPIAWCRTLDRGRSFYTALGHTEESWHEPLFAQHIEGALRWAAAR